MLLFDRCFYQSTQTRLIKGDEEPIYLPVSDDCDYHQVIFAHGFFSSAMHEISHWCIAGEQRRQLVDYGYWYKPDGRSAEEQGIFEQMEVAPQAVEWMLSKAANHRFRISADNLSGEATDSEPFKQAVLAKVSNYFQQGLHERAALFYQALLDFYCPSQVLSVSHFSLDEL
jgi:elongation factor P hydroxylase